jgi:hypothetical protein
MGKLKITLKIINLTSIKRDINFHYTLPEKKSSQKDDKNANLMFGLSFTVVKYCYFNRFQFLLDLGLIGSDLIFFC